MQNMEMIWAEGLGIKGRSRQSEGSCTVNFYRVLKKKRQVFLLRAGWEARKGVLMNLKGGIQWSWGGATHKGQKGIISCKRWGGVGGVPSLDAPLPPLLSFLFPGSFVSLVSLSRLS